MQDSINKLARRSVLSLTVALATLAGVTVFSGYQTVSAQQADNSGPDPADANMAPADASQPDNSQLQQPQQPQQPEQQQLQPSTGGAPVYRAAPPSTPNDSQQPPDQYAPPADQQNPAAQSGNPSYENQVDAGQAALDDEQASAPPPALPTYDQPEAPAPNYIWTPGYWGYAPAGYYWVPGVWCSAPYYGALWTPGYWGFYNGFYRFHRGYWGPYIGFYGGINYGFGYTGLGYYGGYWRGSNFYYNTTVNRVNVSRVSFVYSRPVVVSNYSRVAYNGGRGGLTVRPNASQMVAMRQTRTPPMTMQLQNQRSAAQNRQQFYDQNRGRPAITAAPRPISADRGIQRPASQPTNQARPYQPQTRPDQPYNRPNQPQVQHYQPQQPQRPNEPRPQTTQRPAPQQRPQPQAKAQAPKSEEHPH